MCLYVCMSFYLPCSLHVYIIQFIRQFSAVLVSLFIIMQYNSYTVSAKWHKMCNIIYISCKGATQIEFLTFPFRLYFSRRYLLFSTFIKHYLIRPYHHHHESLWWDLDAKRNKLLNAFGKILHAISEEGSRHSHHYHKFRHMILISTQSEGLYSSLNRQM